MNQVMKQRQVNYIHAVMLKTWDPTANKMIMWRWIYPDWSPETIYMMFAMPHIHTALIKPNGSAQDFENAIVQNLYDIK